MKTVYVEFWTDFVCPWCWIGKHRLERAARQLDGEVRVLLAHRASRVARGMEPADYRDAVSRQLGGAARARQMMESVRARGATEGLMYDFSGMRLGDTGAAHVLLKAVPDPAGRHALVEALYQAAMRDGRDIFSLEVLLRLTRDAGIDTAALADVDFSATAAIEADEFEAHALASGVPLLRCNGSLILTGAQPVAAMIKTLRDSARIRPEHALPPAHQL